jgi:hypothetical protein
MSDPPPCLKCGSTFSYEDRGMYVCPEREHEWTQAAIKEAADQQRIVRDAYETEPHDGDRGHRFRARLSGAIRAWVPGRYTVLGTDGFGRSDARAPLREYFGVDARHILLAALSALAHEGKFERAHRGRDRAVRARRQ